MKCTGCPHLQMKRPWGHGMAALRCMNAEAVRYYGRVLSVVNENYAATEAAVMRAPVWCPKNKTQ